MASLRRYEEIRERLKGPVFSIITPFKESDDSIDYQSLDRYISLLFTSGAKCFYVMGYNSRFSELSWDEIKDLNSFVIKKTKELDRDNVAIVADPLHCSTKVSIDFALHAESEGADMISLICREKFYSKRQIYTHFKTISDECNLGILLHEMPFLNGRGKGLVNYPTSLLDKLADIDNIIAIKEDAKEDVYSREVIETVKDRASIIISGGGLRQWMRFAQYGCPAWLNGISVFAPKLELKFWDAYKRGDHKLCEDIIAEIEIPFFEQGVKKYGWHLSAKAALEALGLMSRHERLPMLALDKDEAKVICDLIHSLPIGKFT